MLAKAHKRGRSILVPSPTVILSLDELSEANQQFQQAMPPGSRATCSATLCQPLFQETKGFKDLFPPCVYKS